MLLVSEKERQQQRKRVLLRENEIAELQARFFEGVFTLEIRCHQGKSPEIVLGGDCDCFSSLQIKRDIHRKRVRRGEDPVPPLDRLRTFRDWGLESRLEEDRRCSLHSP